MALVDFTTFDDVRAALGVSNEELEDATLSLAVYDFNLVAELEEMNPSPLDTYLALKDSDLETMSATESRLFRSVRLLSTYIVARHLLSSLPMFGPKEYGDGKAHVTRFSTDPYRETIKRVEEQYSKQVARVVAALAAFNSVSTFKTTPVFFSTSRGVDPVTGE